MEMNIEQIKQLEEIEVKDRFRITDDQGAEWTLKKIKQYEKEMNRLMELIKAEQEELKKKENQIKKEYERNLEYFSGLLEEYFRENELDVKETKTQFSYKLLSGDLIYKKEKQKIIKVDEEELTKELDGSKYVENVKKLKWGDLKKSLKIEGSKVVNIETGEVYKGVDIETEPEMFTVKIK